MRSELTIKNEYLALGTYGLTAFGAWAAMSGGSKEAAPKSVEGARQSVKVGASSKYVLYFRCLYRRFLVLMLPLLPTFREEEDLYVALLGQHLRPVH